MILHHDNIDELSARQLYNLLLLREQVFHLEQCITEADLDGRELDPGTFFFWHEDGRGLPVSHARVMIDGEVAQIGRVAVAREARKAGLGKELMLEAVNWAFKVQRVERVDIHAQAYLEDWYSRMGFVRTGENIEEAGIDHVPMSITPETLQNSK